jgi:tubulin polyglutamylase TTLL5
MLDRIRGDYDSSNSDIMLYRVVSFHRTKEWHELPHGMELRVSWNLLWTWSKPQIDFTDLFYFQKVNHFIGNKQIARKDLLKKNIENVQKLGGKIKQYFDIIP